MNQPPLIAHVIHHLVIGGLENGLVNLINSIPESKYRHVIVCMDDYSDFEKRIRRSDVEVIAMHKRPGQDPITQWRLFKLFRRLKPAILHTRNLTALDALLPGMLAGIEVRIHGEHGRDVYDPDGRNKKLQLLRKLHRPLVKRYITVSKDLESYLTKQIGVKQDSIAQIYNGVDTERFYPANAEDSRDVFPEGFATDRHIVFGTVGRIQPVKNHRMLLEGFRLLLDRSPDLKGIVRLAIVGTGPLIGEVKEFITRHDLSAYTWLPGARHDIPDVLRCFDVFALTSVGEGISNTILEAMASGLPVVATAVGGNTELVIDGETGQTVPSNNPQSLAVAFERYVRDPDYRQNQAFASRQRALAAFSLDTMIRRYTDIYDHSLNVASVESQV